MKQPVIAVIEDEGTIAHAVTARLRAEGFHVEVAQDGPGGVELCRRLVPDLVVLDVMLPGFDGLEVCRRIQAERCVPVLMLTARDSETDLIVGLSVGADDYLTKPFSPRELVARVRAILRRVERSAARPRERVSLGALEIDPATRAVVRDGEAIHLTPIEFDLLHLMASRPAIVHTRQQLLEHVWGYREESGSRTVDSHIAALRRKVGAEAIRTVHGVGYAANGAHA